MAAGGNSANIHLGPGRLYYAPVGTAEPTSASTALDPAFVPVGYTEDGTQVETEITSEAVEVAEELDPVLYSMTRRASRITFAMAEMTVKRLALAMGGGAARSEVGGAATQPFVFPDPSSIQPVMFVWDSAESPTDANNRRWVIYQARPSGTITTQRRKAPQKATLPVTFNCELASGQTTPIKVWPGPNGRI